MGPSTSPVVHEVVVPVAEGVVAADVTGPSEVFERTRLDDGSAPYRVRVASAEAEVDAGTFVMRMPHRLDVLEEADTILLPGMADPSRTPSAELLAAVRRAHERGARVASVCVGAFTLAETGLLDGLRATTHWAAAGDLARVYPRITVDPSVLYVDNGSLLSSAGAAAGLDLCIHLVRRDHGADVAARSARAVVMPVERAGGQAQFITHVPPTPDGSGLGPLLEWMQVHHADSLGVGDLARQAAMSTRTLTRRFAEQLGTTPMAHLRTIRIRRAQQLLETTERSVETIAHHVGIASVTTFRASFVALVGTSPTAYRHAFSTLRPRTRPSRPPRGDGTARPDSGGVRR